MFRCKSRDKFNTLCISGRSRTLWVFSVGLYSLNSLTSNASLTQWLSLWCSAVVNDPFLFDVYIQLRCSAPYVLESISLVVLQIPQPKEPDGRHWWYTTPLLFSLGVWPLVFLNFHLILRRRVSVAQQFHVSLRFSGAFRTVHVHMITQYESLW